MSFNPNARLDPSQVQDQRGRGGMPGGRGGQMVAGGGGLSILVLVVSLLLGVNPADLIGSAGNAVTQQQTGSGPQSAQECQTGADANRRDDCRIVGFVNSVQGYWDGEFKRRGKQYQNAPMVLFSGSTQAGCGFASGAQGPFYCPTDGKVYLDLSFFQELQSKLGARGGPFAQGYVVAHEYGHHVQHQLGLISENGGRSSGSQGMSVRTELQADCLAGVWTRHANETGYLAKPTDAEIADALDAASSVGDDRIQRASQGRVSPETWTHGSSQQRQQWYRVGFTTGDMVKCDTSSGSV